MPGLSFYEKQHIQKILAQNNTVAGIFNSFITSIAPRLQQWSERSSTSVWLRNQGVEGAIDRELEKLHSLLLSNITEFQIDAWNRSGRKHEDFITEYIKGMAISEAKKSGLFAVNSNALDQYKKGLDSRGNVLSSRVWQLADQTKLQLEYYLQTGLSVGRSASQISSDVRQILDQPDKRFRRIKNEEGKLILSRPMKDYHPGQGVYRSAKMNALRLTSTSTNIAYRSADYERWSQQDFVLGIEIQRSGNNKGPCRICDPMVGEYPKTFKFTGFHPFCICFATPKVLSPDRMADYLLTDKVSSYGLVRSIPTSAKEFIRNNKESVKTSYWYQDNFADGKNANLLTIRKPKQAKEKIVEQKVTKEEKPRELTLNEKLVSTENEIRKNAKFETAVAFDAEGNVVIDKRGAATSVGFTREECALMKDCVLTHNHPLGWMAKEGTLGRIGNSFSKEDVFLAISKNVAEIRAVTPTYTFVMKRPENGWPIAIHDAEREYQRLNREIKKEMDTAVSKTKTYREEDITCQRASALHYHLIWKRFAKANGIDYSKAKTI
ncbi:MAG: hypothetical protein ACRCUJ_06505 [Phocaeicola sp.]